MFLRGVLWNCSLIPSCLCWYLQTLLNTFDTFTHKVNHAPLISFLLTFYSLSENGITCDGVHELAGVLHVNKSLQRLKWVKQFKFLFIRNVHWDCSAIPRPMQILANTAKLHLTLYITCKDNCVESRSQAPAKLFLTCHTIPRMNEARLLIHLHKVKGFVEPPPLRGSLTFCSPMGNKISRA